MIETVISLLMKLLPLRIGFVSWDGNVLTISGENWSFSTLSAWRIVQEGAISFACWDRDVDTKIESIKGESIVGVARQGILVGVDPVLELSNGKKLEVFSSDTFEPWVLKLPDGSIFTGALN